MLPLYPPFGQRVPGRDCAEASVTASNNVATAKNTIIFIPFSLTLPIVAAPATSVMNWRRLTSSMGPPPESVGPAYRRRSHTSACPPWQRVEAVVAASVASGAAASVALAAACGNPHLTHSITSSARASTISGTVMPSALAVLRLTTSSYLVGCSAGRSAGLAPLRMRST
jgi:hypothetical protein